MRKFNSEEEAILRGDLQVTPDYCALWTPQPGMSIPDDATGWIWLGITPNARHFQIRLSQHSARLDGKAGI
jgi:hypothetical protein